MQKIKNFEFLRIMLLLGIVLHHAFINSNWSLYKMFPDIQLYESLYKNFMYANNGVEGFFIISGFLFVLTFKSEQSLYDFIKSKYIRLAPVIIAGTFICAVAAVYKMIEFKIIPNILTMLLLNNFIIRWGTGCIGSVWYVSALFTCFIIFYLIKKRTINKDKYIKIIFWSFVGGYALIEILKGRSFANPGRTYFFIFNIGFLRAFGGIALGMLIAEYYKKYKDKIENLNFNKMQYLYISAGEFILLSALIWWSFVEHKKVNNILYVFIFAGLLIFFILRKGLFSKLLNNNIWVFAAKYSYSIFVTHTLIYKLFSYYFWANYSDTVHKYIWLPVLSNLLLVILLGILMYHLVEQPVINYFKKKK